MRYPVLSDGIAYLRDPLRKNAIFLIAASALSVLIGFFFWTIAARLYSAEDIGRATALVSAANLIAMLSGLGMGIGIIRYLPEEENKTALINTVITVVSSIAFLLAVIFVAGVNIWSPALGFLQDSYLLASIFVLYTVCTVDSGMQTGVFVAFRSAQYSFYQGLVVAIKIVLLAFLLSYGFTGIFTAFALGVVISVITANFFIRILHRRYMPFPIFHQRILGKIIHFSTGNYIGDTFRSLPGLVMPLIIVNMLCPQMSAYFYVAWMIAGLFFIVPYAVYYSLVAEMGYAPGELKKHALKALKLTLLILVPAIIVTWFLSSFLLSLFGSDYQQESLWLLRILIISSIPLALNERYIAVCRIRRKTTPIIMVYTYIALFTIGAGAALLRPIGLIGIGIAWLAGNLIITVITSIIITKEFFT